MTTILFDTETTGLLKPSINRLDAQPYIVQLYAMKIDDEFDIIDEIDLLIKPPIPIPPETTKIHGIDDYAVKNSMTFSELIPRLADFFLGVEKLVAHNLGYDRSMLANELLRQDAVLKFPWPPVHICTVEQSMHIEQRRLRLSQLHKYATGHEHVDQHSARGDVTALLRCFKWLREGGKA